MFIKYQKIVRNDADVIVSGSASLISSSYSPNKEGNHKKSHAKESVIEKLGKVITNVKPASSDLMNLPLESLFGIFI